MSSVFSTVAAVSTPRGKGGIAVIRITGAEAALVADGMFRPKFTKKYPTLSAHPPRTAVFGTILDEENQPCDEGVAILYRAPASFTGEDLAEISCHGGPAVTEAVYLSALAHGASPAGPGDFTRRAFLSGKLSLTEAEAVGRLIDADTRDRMALSGGAVRGNVSRAIGAISDSLLTVMTALYAAIDYPEEDVGNEGEEQISAVLHANLTEIRQILATYKLGKAVSDGVRCTICGRPNVGKSSLFNCITGEDSAIVTSIAGTTRDILRETVSFGGVTLRLSDTAGIHDAEEAVEKIGIDRAEREIREAELIFAVFDRSEPLTDEDRRLLALLKTAAAPVLVILNKSDRPSALTDADLKELRNIHPNPIPISAGSDTVNPAENGIGDLSAAVADLFGSGQVDLARDAVIWDVRQRELLRRAEIALSGAADGIDNGDPLDCICTLAEEALAALNETDGRGIDETIVAEIFKRFCVGK